ncbi:hypothetical protein BDY24DRAFT_418061 [Mrakia frigida]|uniref:F-box protein n=1 Tax=Mrakia frigida TaxID=29902 RepID=UPI003FCBF971
MPRPNAVIRGIVDLPLPRVRISSLPLEIITYIFKFCSKESLAMLSAVCWSFSLSILSHPSLQHLDFKPNDLGRIGQRFDSVDRRIREHPIVVPVCVYRGYRGEPAAFFALLLHYRRTLNIQVRQLNLDTFTDRSKQALRLLTTISPLGVTSLVLTLTEHRLPFPALFHDGDWIRRVLLAHPTIDSLSFEIDSQVPQQVHFPWRSLVLVEGLGRVVAPSLQEWFDSARMHDVKLRLRRLDEGLVEIVELEIWADPELEGETSSFRTDQLEALVEFLPRLELLKIHGDYVGNGSPPTFLNALSQLPRLRHVHLPFAYCFDEPFVCQHIIDRLEEELVESLSPWQEDAELSEDDAEDEEGEDAPLENPKEEEPEWLEWLDEQGVNDILSVPSSASQSSESLVESSAFRILGSEITTGSAASFEDGEVEMGCFESRRNVGNLARRRRFQVRLALDPSFSTFRKLDPMSTFDARPLPPLPYESSKALVYRSEFHINPSSIAMESTRKFGSPGLKNFRFPSSQTFFFVT